MNAKKSTKSLTIEIEPDQYEAVKNFANSQERSMSFVARKALKAFLGSIEMSSATFQDRGSGGVNTPADSTQSPKGV